MATNYYLEITIHFPQSNMSAIPLYIRWVLPIWPPLASVMHARRVIQLVFRSVVAQYSVKSEMYHAKKIKDIAKESKRIAKPTTIN